jgi:integrase
MAQAKINFTDNRLRTLSHDGSNKRLYFYDTAQPSLALSLTPSGTKSFQLQAWDKKRGKSVVKSIGRYPNMSITLAREAVVGLLSDISKGVNVIAKAKKKRDEECLDDVFERWLEEAKQHKRSWQHDKSRYDLYIHKPLGKKRITDIDRDMVREWFSKLTNMSSPRGKLSKTTANRIFAILRTVFNQELPDINNPCKGVKQYQEYSRDRFLHPSELERFFEALEDEQTPELLRDYVNLSLFTGARRSNILSMMWSDIDFNTRIWSIRGQDFKNKSSLAIPLIDLAIEILLRRRKVATSVFVFPCEGRNKSKSGHLMDPRKDWSELLIRAMLEDVRLHDLRRTMGSYQTMTGASTTIVGKTLGHKSHAATAVYARLNLDPVRASMEKAVDLMMASKELPAKVVQLKKGNE